MPSFKIKPQKKIRFDKKTAVTLDSKHREIVNDLDKDINERIPGIKNEIHELNDKIKKSFGFEQIMELQEAISEKKNTIKSLKSRKNEYLLDNSKLIFEYFETKKNISDTNVTSKNQALNSFFKIKQDDDNVMNNQRKSHNIVQTYLGKLDDNFFDISAFVCQTDICRYCNKGEMLPLEDEGVLICSECSRNVPYLIENEKPSYKEAPKEICFYAYKRINHFKEIIAQFQGKETTQIPANVIESIKNQVKKERIELLTISNEKTKDILKKLGYNKYYEHIPFIKDKLGIKPPIMSPDLEDTLCNLFAELQAPYSKYCPDDRVNFLNYYYTAYKLCELLGESSYLPFFPMLKDREKRIEQDTIWRNICEELDWEFIPTI